MIMKYKGITIIEMLIVTGIFGIFLSLIGLMCVESVRAFNRSKDKIESRQEAQLALDKLCRELNESYNRGINIQVSNWNGGSDNYDAISFPTSRLNNDASGNTTLTNGKLSWSRYLIYFKQPGNTDLYRRVVDPVNPDYPKYVLYPSPLFIDMFTMFLNVPAPVACPYNVVSGSNSGIITNERKIARQIYNISFELYNPTLDNYALPIINITVESRVTKNNNSKVYESTILSTTVKPVNN